MFTRNTHSVLRFSTGACAALIMAAGGMGCFGGHGKHTQAHLNAAQAKMSAMKSATEWDMARQAFLAGDLDKALKHVDDSIALNASVPKSHVLRGRILMEMGNMNGAMESLRTAESLDPQNIDAQYFLGVAHERLGKQDVAAAHYRNASELDTSKAMYAIAAAEMMIDAGQLAEAEQFLVERQSDFEYSAGVRQTLGHIALLGGDAEKARSLFTEARFMAPEDLSVLEDLARAEVATGRFAEAEYNLSQLLEAEGYGDRRDLMHMQSRCLVALDRPVEARDLLTRLTQGDGGAKDVDAWVQLGHVSYVIKDQARLRTCASRVIALTPNRAEGYTLLALYQRSRGDLEGALASLDKACQFRGDDTSPLVLKGLVARKLEQFDTARSAFETASAEDPDNASLKALLDTLPGETFATVPDDGGN
ncbi:MAG: tetratricopeptide repeat protein [Phycisphaerales bacterium JB039]